MAGRLATGNVTTSADGPREQETNGSPEKGSAALVQLRAEKEALQAQVADLQACCSSAYHLRAENEAMRSQLEGLQHSQSPSYSQLQMENVSLRKNVAELQVHS